MSLSDDLDAVCVAVARAANELEEVDEFEDDGGVLISRDAWEELQEALKEWRVASERFLAGT